MAGDRQRPAPVDVISPTAAIPGPGHRRSAADVPARLAPATPRRSRYDTRVRRGTYVFYSPYLSHHDPRQFPDPDAFDPDRWLPDRRRHLDRHAHIPFAAGPHKCIGNTFSILQAQAALATIPTGWRLRQSPGHLLRPDVFTSLTPGGLHMIAEKRA